MTTSELLLYDCCKTAIFVVTSTAVQHMHNIVAQYIVSIIVSSEVLTQWFAFTVYFIITIIVLYYRYTITIITIIFRCELSLSFHCMIAHASLLQIAPQVQW